MNLEYVKITCDDGFLHSRNASTIKMEILGRFLSDIGCDRFYKHWAISDEIWAESGGTNTTFFEKNGESIFLEDAIVEEEEIPNRLEISRQQFIQLLDDWQEKVCIPRPKEAIIKYENGQYTIETSNQLTLLF